jgi:hypothetical protein
MSSDIRNVAPSKASQESPAPRYAPGEDWRVSIRAADKHLASCGSIGFSGRRVGTTYAYTPRGVWGITHEPWFRFRNDDCADACREAWSIEPPTAGDFFDVFDGRRPDVGYSSRVDAPELRRCALVRWEAEPYRGAQLHRIGDTDIFQCLQKRPDYFWYPVGRLLRLNAVGRVALSPRVAGSSEPPEERKDGAIDPSSPLPNPPPKEGEKET